MKKLPRITRAEAVIHGVLKLVWDDHYEGVVDLRPVIERGRLFTYLQKRENFAKFKVEEYGHSVGWIDDEGHEIDFDAYNLRLKAENQAQLQKLVANMRV